MSKKNFGGGSSTMSAPEQRIPGEDIKKILAERGIRHYDAARALDITPNYFSMRLKGDFSAEELEQIVGPGTHEATEAAPQPVGKSIAQEDFNIVIDHYRDEFIDMAFSRPDVLLFIGEVVDAIKEAHCRKEYVPIETWDYVEVS